MATVNQELRTLIKQLDVYLKGDITAEEVEDKYTTALIVHDDYEELDERIQHIIEILDSDLKALTSQEIQELRQELAGSLG